MTIPVQDETFAVQEFVGEGGFARVFSASWVTGPPYLQDVVLKIQMPVNDWEWYCLNVLHSRYNVSERSEGKFFLVKNNNLHLACDFLLLLFIEHLLF